MKYRNLLDPSINKGPWTIDEEKHLLELVGTKYGCHDWCSIAAELGTNRTPIACLKHYQRSLNRELVNEDPWLNDEDSLLEDAIALYGEDNWKHVANAVPGRAPVQCKSRWKKLAEERMYLKSGKWSTLEEKMLFLAAVAFKLPSIRDTKKSPAELQSLLEQPELSQSDIDNDENHTRASKRRRFPQVKGGEGGEYQGNESDNSTVDEEEQCLPDAVQPTWYEVARLIPGRSG